MSRTCTTSAAHRGQVLFPADPRLFRRCLRLPRPRRPCWNPCLYRWRRRPEPPAGASPCGCCSGWVSCPCSVWFSVSSGSGCSCSPVSSLLVLPPEPAASGAFRFAVSGVTGRLSGLQDGDLLRRGLQDGIVRLGRPHAHERQTDTQQQRTDQYAAAGLLHPWVPFKEIFSCVFALREKGFPLKKVCILCSLFVLLRSSLKRTNKPHGSPRFRVGNRPAWGGYPIFNSERWTACFILRFFP